MSKLISGKEALIALANGEEVEIEVNHAWLSCDYLKGTQIQYVIEDYYRFRLKPRTITINGIEVPSPFEPKDGDLVFYISDSGRSGYSHSHHQSYFNYKFGAWRTEEEIKQVVAALRQVFKGEQA